MRIVVDIEANGLKPDQIWLIVCKDIDTGQFHIFRNLTTDPFERERFIDFWRRCKYYIGHNLLGYDAPVLENLLGVSISDVGRDCCDTLIISKLVDYPRAGHSIEHYGEEFGLLKGKFTDFSKYSIEMEEYCVRDVEICHKVYLKYLRYILKEEHKDSIKEEHKFQLVVNNLSTNGFSFNKVKAEGYLKDILRDLKVLDEKLLKEFPDKLKLIKEVNPKVTKHGTLSKTDFRWLGHSDLSEFNGGPFCRCDWESFNPSSHKQIIQVLSGAGWSPVDKTQTHIDTERELNKLKYQRQRSTELDIRVRELYTKLNNLKSSGWKINENNLETLPPSAPLSARSLAKRILLESRRRTLTEWLSLVTPEARIHGKFYGIGAWTHRMAHQNPNTANIPNELDTFGKKKLLGKELRSLWQAPKNRLLVGVDAEGIQLRIFAHLIDDPEFTEALVKGSKHDKTDPHSFNQRVLGNVCRSRQAAKRFIYALLLGAGMSKLVEILGCSESETKEALSRLMARYTGWQQLKEEVFPKDARRGYFIGLDGRKVRIPGDTESARRHLAMSGYLQNGEKVVMSRATNKFEHKLIDYDALLVNLVHDEWQVECPNNMEIALWIAREMADSLCQVGIDLGLKCPLAGSFWNDDLNGGKGDYTIATNWAYTH